jgi:5-dehydro-2-deoxygluconokinase
MSLQINVKVQQAMQNKTLDVIALGRSSVDLYGDQFGGPLQDVQSFSKYVGGCPCNIAVGTSRLGLKSVLITRVGAEQLGDFIRQKLTDEGVDTRGISVDPNRLTALVILAVENRESFPHIFYRSDCADMALKAEHIDAEYISSSRALVITGTHLSVAGVDAATLKAVRCAKNSDTKLVLDIDYRPVLWGLTGAATGESRFVASEVVTQKFGEVLPHCDLIVGTEEEIHIAGGSENTLEALQLIREKSEATIVLKLGEDGCRIFESEIPECLAEQKIFPGMMIDIFNTLGAGDAFMSGLLYGWLNNQTWETSCRYANACGAIVVSRHGCAPAMPGLEELDIFLEQSENARAVLASGKLQHAHWVVGRRPRIEQVYALAFDHRSQLEDLVEQYQQGRDCIVKIKELIAAAAQNCLQSYEMAGVIIDDKYGGDILPKFTNKNIWVARPVEKPGVMPFEFEQEEQFALHMHSWPQEHIAKCLVFHHPEATKETRKIQAKKIKALFQACRATNHELLLEIIPPSNLNLTDQTVANSMADIYRQEIYPDWWKLPPSPSASTWSAIESVIEANDKHCRGILVLGLDAPLDELEYCFKAVSGVNYCVGFAIGRSVFRNAAESWIQGKLDDKGMVDTVTDNFVQVITAWENRHLSNDSTLQPGVG